MFLLECLLLAAVALLLAWAWWTGGSACSSTSTAPKIQTLARTPIDRLREEARIMKRSAAKKKTQTPEIMKETRMGTGVESRTARFLRKHEKVSDGDRSAHHPEEWDGDRPR